MACKYATLTLFLGGSDWPSWSIKLVSLKWNRWLQILKSHCGQTLVTWPWIGRPWAVEGHVPFNTDWRADAHSPPPSALMSMKAGRAEGHCYSSFMNCELVTTCCDENFPTTSLHATLCNFNLLKLSNLAEGSDLSVAHCEMTITSSEPSLIFH